MKSIRVVLIIALVVVNGTMAHAQRPGAARSKGVVTDIRRVDFLNFTYHPSLCSKDEFGIPKTVRVRNGEYKNRESYLGVSVIYGDVTGDGQNDAIVRGVCGANGSTYGVDEVFIYIAKWTRRITGAN
jgi:hypothetical protein